MEFSSNDIMHHESIYWPFSMWLCILRNTTPPPPPKSHHHQDTHNLHPHPCSPNTHAHTPTNAHLNTHTYTCTHTCTRTHSFSPSLTSNTHAHTHCHTHTHNSDTQTCMHATHSTHILPIWYLIKHPTLSPTPTIKKRITLGWLIAPWKVSVVSSVTHRDGGLNAQLSCRAEGTERSSRFRKPLVKLRMKDAEIAQGEHQEGWMYTPATVSVESGRVIHTDPINCHVVSPSFQPCGWLWADTNTVTGSEKMCKWTLWLKIIIASQKATLFGLFATVAMMGTCMVAVLSTFSRYSRGHSDE